MYFKHTVITTCWSFKLVQTNALTGIRTQDLPDHNQNVTIDALDHLAMKAGLEVNFKMFVWSGYKL